ncbi:MAG: hypothetical protein GXY44_14300, partial [Phycisphaerales bacterium]|nr:hypothetical protein [Phycisphaerales bacterium]
MMYIRSWTKRLLRGMIGALVLAAVMGPSCADFPIILPEGNPVRVELVNTTDYYVDPGLYIHPDADVYDNARLISDETWIDIGDPLAPLEMWAYDFRCSETGTVVSDFAWLFLNDEEYIASENSPWITIGQHFECGDTIRFIFVDTIEGGFYTEVWVNDVRIDGVARPVSVELINETDYYVDPGLYVHPDANVYDEAQLISDETWIDIGEPLAPLEMWTSDFDCAESGTVVSDFAWPRISHMTLTTAYNEVTIPIMNTGENEPQAAEIRRMQWVKHAR